MKITSDWANRAKAQWLLRREEGYQGMLFPIVQGNFYKELRKESADFVANLDLPGIAIGGLSVGETFDVYISIRKHFNSINGKPATIKRAHHLAVIVAFKIGF